MAGSGKVAWLATRLLRATVASKTDGADLASVICREEVRRVARTAVVVRNTLRLLDELAVGAFPGNARQALFSKKYPASQDPQCPCLMRLACSMSVPLAHCPAHCLHALSSRKCPAWHEPQ